MKTVAFIPIKMNNERTPGKNTRRVFGNKCILEIMQDTLLKVKGLDEIYVFCSNDAIEEYIVEGVKFLCRPDYLDTPSATPNDIISEFMKRIEADVYLACHATSPFVNTAHFEECIISVESGKYDSSFTAEKIQKLLWKDDGTPLNFDPEHVPRTQDLDPIYNEVSACYAFTKETFLKYHRRIGVKPHMTIVSGVECIDIDYPEDLETAKAVYKEIIMKR